jgi:peptidoglycan hydrolase-like protein with peptidoglycan-binding domain
MRLGSTGDDVQELQKYLISQGYLVLRNPTKYFGPMTRTALKKWQKAKGLPDTGYFGPMSRAAIIQ